VARLAELGEAPSFLGSSEVNALIVNADRLGLKGKVALQECRRISPSTAVVVVATTAARGLKDALEGGATAFVSWPAPPEVIRRALRSGREEAPPRP
jgi:DNA-binding NarL/FixJ family response regulator